MTAPKVHRIDNLMRELCARPWAILPGKLEAILEFLQLRAAGVTFTAEEIRARVGDGQRDPASGPGIAILPLYGLVAHRLSAADISGPGATSTIAFGRAFDEAMANSNVATIIADVDSPGGTIDGVPELAAKIRAARGQGKRLIAVSNALMASAAYWIGSAFDEVVAAPSSFTGSIGVYTVHYDLSAAYAQAGIAPTIVSSGRFKTEGNELEPLSEDARARLQAVSDQAYELFVRDVAMQRGVTPAAVREGFGEGRVLLAKEAVAAGLADRVASLDDTIARFAKPTRAATAASGRRADVARRRLALEG